MSSSFKESNIWRIGLIVGGVAAIAVSAGFYVLGGRDNAVPVDRTSQTYLSDANISTQVSLLGDTFSGYSTFRNDIFRSKLGQFGIGLNYIEEFDQKARAEALSSGQADILVTTLDQFLIHRPMGKIVGIIDRTIGADAVVLNSHKYPGLNDLKDLRKLIEEAKGKGKKLEIAFAVDTPSEFLALMLDIKFEDFNMSDFEQVHVEDASEAWNLLKNPTRNVAIAIIWEPYVTSALKEAYNVLLSSNDTPTSIIDVIVASDKFIKNSPEQLSEFLEAYYQRIDTNIPDPKALNLQIAEDGDLTTEEAHAVMEGIYFFSAAEAEKGISGGFLEERIDSISKVLLASGRLTGLPDKPELLFTSDFIEKASMNTNILIDQLKDRDPTMADRLTGKAMPAVEATPVADTVKKEIGNLDVKGNVEFQVGSAVLTEIGRQTLQHLAAAIKEFNPQTVAIRVIGHTSHTGGAALNKKLSMERANTVVAYLRELGVKNSMEAIGKGFDQPLPDIPETDARNQRTQINLFRVDALAQTQEPEEGAVASQPQ